MELGDAALSYAKRGWYVFPLKPRNKIPLAGSHGHQDATTDHQLLESWWKANHMANIGLACGPSGIVAIDLDQEHDGLDNWKELCNEHQIDDNTVTSLTGGGGHHLLFKAPKDVTIGNSAGRLGPGIDVRGNGGYIVLPPSVHENGRLYRWEVTYDLDFPMAPFPEQLINLLNTSKRKRLYHKNGGLIPIGKRNDTLTSLGGTMRRRGMSPESIESALLAENKKSCSTPLDDSEVMKIAASVSKYEPSDSHHKSNSKTFNLTDVGNAQRLVSRHGEDLCYCHPWKKWFIWDGARWLKDSTGEIQRRAKETVRNIYAEAAIIEDSGLRQKVGNHARKSESEQRLKAMINLAQSEISVPVLPEELDRHLWLLNCPNGTFDLKAGNLREHRREDMLTSMVQVEYDPSARCPRWDAFLYRIMDGNEDLMNFLQRAIGYSLTGDISEQCMFVLYGSGANGKTTFLETIVSLLCDHARRNPIETFMMSRRDSIPNDIARLAGARLVAASEAEEGRRLSESQLKQLTGGDTVTARFLHKEWFEYKPEFKIWLATNHKPVIRGSDHAIWRRIRLVPFEVKIPEQEQDRHLPEKLRGELAGILRWAVDGCFAWQESGLGEPEEVRKATIGYRQEMDILGAFLSDCCIEKQGTRAPASDLYGKYTQWCKKAGEKELTATAFGRAVGERGFKKEKETKGRRLTYYCGIGLIDEEE